MKKYIAILILILFCQAGYSQSMDKLFNDFAKQKNVTHVTVGPFLMKISPNYETMVNVNEEGNRTKVMVRIDKDIIRELVILTTDGGDDALIRIKGKIKPSDIEKVINDHKDGC